MTSKHSSVGQVEFVALMAMLMAMVAFSIDAMLPALPQIATELSPHAPNQAQLVVTAFVFGMGAGTFFTGPLSDSFGRKPVVLVGAVLYSAGAVLAIIAPSLELVLIARVLQGLGCAAARIVAMAIIRDLYVGREMARIMSFAMMVFTLVPAIAPLAGQIIIGFAGWRGIFGSFVIFAVITTLWLQIRVPEPLAKSERLPFRISPLWAAAIEVVSIRAVRLSIAVQTLCFTMLFASIISIQQIISDAYGRPEEFPYWFGFVALIAGGASLINAGLVMRLGMRKLVSIAVSAQIALSIVAIMLLQLDLGLTTRFVIFIVWQTGIFVQTSLTLGNLFSLAMEPLGHIAGMAASVISGLATVFSVVLTIPIGLAFDGTPLPLIIGILLCAMASTVLMTKLSGEDVKA